MENYINIEKSYGRLCEAEYRIENVFQPESYDCQGDWEGRALLAFCCLYEMTGSLIPCADALVKSIPEKTNGRLFFKQPFDGVTADEMQIGSHNFWLRGLIKYASLFHSDDAFNAAKATIDALYKPVLPFFKAYPLERNKTVGEVCGFFTGECNGWRLSSDIGGAFMCLDGLSHYYEYTKDAALKDGIDSLIDLFVSTDVVRHGFQTHATLCADRGMLTMYKATSDPAYLKQAISLFDIYLKHGMTLTYENINWFGRPESWTEPCAIVDSLIMATELYKITKKQEYLTLARRIWFNGMQYCQRENGGAGPNACVTPDQPVLKISMYEAMFCCTMRYCEGLLEWYENKELFAWDDDSPEMSDAYGRHFVDDRLIVLYNGKKTPIFSCNTVPREKALEAELTILY